MLTGVRVEQGPPGSAQGSQPCQTGSGFMFIPLALGDRFKYVKYPLQAQAAAGVWVLVGIKKHS